MAKASPRQRSAHGKGPLVRIKSPQGSDVLARVDAANAKLSSPDFTSGFGRQVPRPLQVDGEVWAGNDSATERVFEPRRRSGRGDCRETESHQSVGGKGFQRRCGDVRKGEDLEGDDIAGTKQSKILLASYWAVKSRCAYTVTVSLARYPSLSPVPYWMSQAAVEVSCTPGFSWAVREF